MKKLIYFLFAIAALSCHEQAAKNTNNSKTGRDSSDSFILKNETKNLYVDLDVSVMDMSYFPADYPLLKMNHLTTTPPLARVIYSRPVKHGRKIFGGLIKYDSMWRLGANEATEIEFFKPALVASKKVNPGRYIIYCIPKESSWKLVLNTDLFSWGKVIDSSKDLMSMEIPVEKSARNCEYFTMLFTGTKPTETELLMAWDDVVARLPVKF
jgi:hypothetical protein